MPHQLHTREKTHRLKKLSGRVGVAVQTVTRSAANVAVLVGVTVQAAGRTVAHFAAVVGRRVRRHCVWIIRWLGAAVNGWWDDSGGRADRETRLGRRLIGDCVAFYAGRYPTRLSRRSRWDWAWINTLAHGKRDEIQELASGRHGRRASAAAFAATEVLAAEERHRWDLDWLQRRFLVPLELDCMRGLYRTPSSTAEAVLESLRRAKAVERREHLDQLPPDLAE